MRTKFAKPIGGRLVDGADVEPDWAACAVRHNESLVSPESGQAAEAEGSIRAVAREFGITEKAIRFFEDQGLLEPRRVGRARVYGPRERLHLKMILKGRELGFTLPEIRDILGSRATETDPSGSSEVAGVDLDAIGMSPGGPQGLDAVTLDLAVALRPDQIVAQIDHLERQRRALDDAILALRAAHRHRVARRGGQRLR